MTDAADPPPETGTGDESRILTIPNVHLQNGATLLPSMGCAVTRESLAASAHLTM